MDSQILPKIGNYAVREVNPTVIIDNILRPMWDKGQSGEKVFEALKQGFSWQERNDPKFISPIRNMTKKDIGIVQNKPKRAALTMDEIAEFWYFLDYGENIIRPETKIVFKLILLTGQRTRDVLWAPWEDFDFENKMWIQGKHKTKHITGEVHYVPLSDMAQNFFLKLKAMGHPTATILLEKAPARALNRVQDRIPFDKKFTPHDLRRTMSTRLTADYRYNEVVIDMIQGHVQEGMKRIYQLDDRLDERREILDFWANEIRKKVEDYNP